MGFPGKFSEHLLPDKLHVLNVSFTVNGVVEKFGGTAGNIAYALRLLGQGPVIVAAVGRDRHRYFEWLAENGIGCDNIRVVEDELTACAYITTDQADNQITGFNPGAMKYPTSFSFDTVDPEGSIAIIAPGNLADMASYSHGCRERGIGYIFDPGQSLPMWDETELVGCIDGSSVLISNDYELEMIGSKTGLKMPALLEMTGAVVTTMGEAGSRVVTPEGLVDIPSVKARQVVDPTGAGDAYRAGLIAGLLDGRDLEQSALMGAVCASFAIEHYGTQGYRFSRQEFDGRLAGCRGQG